MTISRPPISPILLNTGQAALLLFEGPWMFSHEKSPDAKSDLLIVTSFDSLPSAPGMHMCEVGNWDGTRLVHPNDPSQDPPTLDSGAEWTFHSSVAPNKAFLDVVPPAFKDKAAVCLDHYNGTVYKLDKRKNDRRVVLPMPESFSLGARLIDSTIEDGGGAALPMQPFVTAILRYGQSTVLTQQGVATPLTASADHRLIFRMRHAMDMHSTPTEENRHVENAFAALMDRVVPKCKMTLTVTSTKTDHVDTGDGFTRGEMGVAPPQSPLRPGLEAGTLADCAGGNLVLGG